jgi:radical SAM protein with 4Fe4S-binding SPASM domain
MISSIVRAVASVASLREPPWIFVNLFARLYGLDLLQVQNLRSEDGGRQAISNLLRSIADYGINTPQTFKAPISVVWSLSYRCNLHCRHCYQNASQPSTDELTLDEQLIIVDQLAKAGVSMIVLSGGEPLTNPNLWTLIERIRAHKIAVSIDSNGVLITKEVVESLKRLGVLSVELSLDSVEANSHDHFRGLEGAFDKTLNALDMCSDGGVFTTVATTATTLNHTKSRELISLARSHGANRVVFFDLIPAGRGRDVEDLRLSGRQLLDLMSMVREESSKGDGEIFTELPQFVIYSLNGDRHPNTQHSHKDLSVERFSVSSFFDCLGPNSLYRRFVPYFGGCPAGRLYCNIQPNGDVTPCMFMPKYPIAGNLRNQSFEEIWTSPTFRALRNRTLLKGRCRECRFVTVCGGCRAKAAAYEGDYLASDPICPLYSLS